MSNPIVRWNARHAVAIFIIALVALVVRLYYVHTAVVDHPLRGDTLQYFAYALNLVDHHVFSLAPPDKPALPDSFRDPGYSTFLAVLVTMFGREQLFYLATLNLQAILSALTVVIYAILARRWLGLTAAVVVGLGLALWPHTITLSGYLLSETLMGVLVAAGIWLTQIATERRHWIPYAAAGLVLAMAALTNAIFAPVPILFGAACIVRHAGSRRLWIIFTLTALLPLAGWGLRGLFLPVGQTASDRAAINLVQGSWPEYHDAWRLSLQGDAASAVIMREMDQEYALFQHDRMDGISAITARMAKQPLRYLGWYAQKPVELWGWKIGIGMGDIYVFPTYYSPLSSSGPLRVTTDVMFFIAPLLLVLAAAGAIILVAQWRRYPPAAWLAVAIAVFITAAFTALQCDARYSTPYRGIEWVLAALAVHAIARAATERRSRRSP